MALPTAVLAAANTIKATQMFAVITPTGGSAIEIPLTKLSADLSVGEITRNIPQGGFITPDRSLPTTREQSYVCTTSDFLASTRALAFGSSVTEGTCEIFVVDPGDASGYVRFQTNAFNCTVLPESDAEFDFENFSEWSFRVKALEIVTETWDGTV
jgi:hypothetical protein